MRYSLSFLIVISTVLFSIMGCNKEYYINNTRSTLLLENKQIENLKFFSSNNGYAYGNGVLYKTMNGGKNWSETLVYENINNIENSFSYFFSKDIVFVILNLGGFHTQVYMSSDGGNSFTKALNETGEIHGFAMVDSSRGYLTSIDKLYAFTISNESINLLLTPGSYDASLGSATTIVSVNEDIVYLLDAEYTSINRTLDGGLTWDNVYYTVQVSKPSTIDFKNNIGIAAGEEGLVSITQDGRNWQSFQISDQIEDAVNIYFLDCQVLDKNTQFLSGYYSTFIIKNNNIEELFMEDGTSMVLEKISFTTDELGYGLINGNIFKIELK